jgi:hypothetical protein
MLFMTLYLVIYHSLQLLLPVLVDHLVCIQRIYNYSAIRVPLAYNVIFSILEDRPARHCCYVYMLCGNFSLFYLAIFILGGSGIPTRILYNHP